MSDQDEMTLVSLFAGVGGFDLAAARAGIRPVLAVEIDNQARGVLAHNFPDVQLLPDVRNVTADDLRRVGAIPERTVLSGGFPCQPFSVAGKREGLADAQGRGDLFFEIARLVDEFRPAWVVLENVPGLLSIDGGRTMGTILGTLSDLGYGWAYRVLDAQFFGVPQRRRRVFIVACLGDDRRPVEVLLEPEGCAGHLEESEPSWAQTSGGVGDGAGAGQPRPFVKAKRAQSDTDDETWRQGGVAPTLNRMDNTGDSRATVVAVIDDARPQYELYDGTRVGDFRVHSDLAPTVISRYRTGGGNVPFTMAGTPDHAVTTTVRRLTPRECERLQGFPDDWTAQRWDEKKGATVTQADSSRYKQAGNAVAVPVAEWILHRLYRVHAETVGVR